MAPHTIPATLAATSTTPAVATATAAVTVTAAARASAEAAPTTATATATGFHGSLACRFLTILIMIHGSLPSCSALTLVRFSNVHVQHHVAS